MKERKEELVELGMVEMGEGYKRRWKEIMVGFEVEMEMKGVRLRIGKKGEKKEVVEVWVMKVKEYKVEGVKEGEKVNGEEGRVGVMKEMEGEVEVEKMGKEIEWFDKWNIEGWDGVGGWVVLKKGKGRKKE